jgi:cyanate lyase
MSELAKEREALSRACVKAMRAKGLTFKSLAGEIGVSPFIAAAALLSQMALPKEVAAGAAKALGLKEAEDFLTEIPYRGSLGMTVPTDPTIYRSTASARSCRYMVRS